MVQLSSSMSFLPYGMHQLSRGREYLDVVTVDICNEDIACWIQTEELWIIHHTVLPLSDTRA